MGRPPKHVMDRLVERLAIDDAGCWIYEGSGPNGYMQISVGQVNGRSCLQFAHRVAYEHWVGPIPDGLQLDHLCRNRACVNPDHLEPVTAQENTRRARALITECPQGHPYDDENTAVVNGQRVCRTCSRARSLARYHEKKEDAA